ncbi:MAG: peptidoglycan recognition family protein [bacterium]
MERTKLYKLVGWGTLALVAVMLLGTAVWLRANPTHLPVSLAISIGAIPFPRGIVIHHSDTPPMMRGRAVDVAIIDEMHAERGFGITDKDGKVYHIGYHFLIQQDGTVLKGRPENLPGEHTHGHNDMLGICLVGTFQAKDNRHHRFGPVVPPPAQLAAAEKLTRELMAKYHLKPDAVFRHRDLTSTDCPGDMFPWDEFKQAIQ